MCSAFFYYRLTNVSILHSGEFEFTLSYHYFFLYFCLLYPRCNIWHFSSYPALYTMQTSNCRTKPDFIHNCSLAYIHVSLARGLSQPWSLEHNSLERVALCVSNNFCKNHCLCNIILLIWLCVTCHGNKILLRRQLHTSQFVAAMFYHHMMLLSPCSLFEGIRPELQKALWSTLKLAYFVKIPKASSQFLWDVPYVSYYDHCNNMLLSCLFQIVPTTVKSLSGHETKTNQYSVTQRVSQKGSLYSV